MSYGRLIFLFACIFNTYVNASNVDEVRYLNSTYSPSPSEYFCIELLELALKASKSKYGDYKLMPVDMDVAHENTTTFLRRNQHINVIWKMTSAQLEQHLQAVYFPVLKGLLGYRIFIIRKNQQHLFHKDVSLAYLKNLPLGQGDYWTDTEILLANKFNVKPGHDSKLLINMLKKERFTYFPRGLHEPWLEISDEKTLAVEENLMLHYPAPTFFFVNKENKRLHQRLSFGLAQLKKTGQFDQLFNNHKSTSDILIKAKVKQRKVFHLYNPFLSEKTSALINNKNLWINLK